MVHISITVELLVKRLSDAEILEKLPDYGELVRIFCLIKFRTKDRWTETHRAIVDTGAHTSVMPYSIWKDSLHEILGEHYIGGIVPDHKMPVKVGILECVLLDRKSNISNAMKIKTFFAPQDTVPLILGFKDLLEKFEIHINCEGISYLREL